MTPTGTVMARGRTARTSSADLRRTPTQPGPLSTQAMSTIESGPRPSDSMT